MNENELRIGLNFTKSVKTGLETTLSKKSELAKYAIREEMFVNDVMMSRDLNYDTGSSNSADTLAELARAVEKAIPGRYQGRNELN